MEYLVGCTGFVGSNLIRSHHFDGMFHSTNIQEAYGQNPDLLVYAGVKAEMYLANQNPQADFQLIEKAIENISKIRPKKIILISTVAVYQNINGVNEFNKIDSESLLPYGKNRLYLENWVEQSSIPYLIVRLPALYGNNLKKNFLYDYIHQIPTILTDKKYKELRNLDNRIELFYVKSENGFYKVNIQKELQKQALKEYLTEVGFSALNFTDSRANYQFYNLEWLWEHLRVAIKNDIRKINLVTEPISITELYQYLSGKKFCNELTRQVPDYDLRTVYADLFGGKNGYLYQKDFVLMDIKKFVLNAKKMEV